MYTAIQRQQMLVTAHDAMQHGLNMGTRIEINHRHYGPELLQHHACFVTLKIDDVLRGCIGSLTAHRSLIDDVAHNAHSAAFLDPRFEPLVTDELALLNTELSILSDTEKLEFSSEKDLLDQIQPFVDGLIISENNTSGTFLPSVWQQLPNPDDFLRHLKTKAGLAEDYWSDTLTVERYSVESF